MVPDRYLCGGMVASCRGLPHAHGERRTLRGGGGGEGGCRLAGSEAASRRRRVWKGGEAASWLVLPFEKAGGDTDTGRVEWQFLHECVRTRALLPPASAYWLLLPSEPVRSAYQPLASSTFLSERTSHQQPAATSQQYSSLTTNQHQPSATSQPNRLWLT
jgi:hypothetical protein